MSDLAPAACAAVLIFLLYCLAAWLQRPNRRTYR